MSENGEIYTAGKNFTLPPALTGWTNSTSASYTNISLEARISFAGSFSCAGDFLSLCWKFIFIVWRWIQQRSIANSGVELRLGGWGFSKSGQKVFISIIIIKHIFKILCSSATFSTWKLGFHNWVTSSLTPVAEDGNNAICKNQKNILCDTYVWMALAGRSMWFWFLKKHTWQLEYRSIAYRTSGQARVSILMREPHTYKSHLWSQSTW